jgi:hypothetical protein
MREPFSGTEVGALATGHTQVPDEADEALDQLLDSLVADPSLGSPGWNPSNNIPQGTGALPTITGAGLDSSTHTFASGDIASQSMGILATPSQHPSAGQQLTPQTPALPATSIYIAGHVQLQQSPAAPFTSLLQGHPSAGDMVTTSQSSSQLPYYPPPDSSMSARGAHASPVLGATAAAQLNSAHHIARQMSIHSTALPGSHMGHATAPAPTTMPTLPALHSVHAPAPPEPATTALPAIPAMSSSLASDPTQQATHQGPRPPAALPPSAAPHTTQPSKQQPLQRPQARRSRRGPVRSQDPVKATEIWRWLTTGHGLEGVPLVTAPPTDPLAPGPPR